MSNLRWTICKRFEFSASHRLDTLPETHPCFRLHGHNYAVEVELGSDVLNEHSFVFDYRLMDPFKQWIDNVIDHRHLNDLAPNGLTSAERLAQWLHDIVCAFVPANVRVLAVRVSETPKTWAEFRP